MVDFYGRQSDAIRQKKLFLLDMDGTIYLENDLFDGALDFLRTIVDRGGRYVFITNNSSKSVDEYVEKVNRMGIPADRSNFYTSVQATAFFLKKHHPGALVYVQGTAAMVGELRALGIRVTEQVEPKIDVVLTAFDTELTSAKLRNTCEALLQPVAYYGTNPDLVCPVSFGYVPDCGSVAVMLKNATGKYPKFIGKPEPTMIQLVMEQFGIQPEETTVIGDRLYTDIASGVNAGVTSMLVLSGEATEADLKASDVQPDFVFESIREINAVLKA